MQGYHDECHHDDEVADDHDMHNHDADDIEALGKPGAGAYGMLYTALRSSTLHVY